MDPTVEYVEWKERVKDRLIRQGYDYPTSPDAMARALAQVEHALVRTLGPRLVYDAGRAVSAPTPPPPPEQPFGWQDVALLMRRLHDAGLIPARARVEAPVAREIWHVTEEQALAMFYRDINAEGVDRLLVLRTYAEIAIERDADWNPADVRAQWDATRHAVSARLCAQNCFGCLSGDRALSWHHIIQIQHGGTNTVRNLTSLCDHCHRVIHPWMPAEVRRPSHGFTALGDLLEQWKAAFADRDSSAFPSEEEN